MRRPTIFYRIAGELKIAKLVCVCVADTFSCFQFKFNSRVLRAQWRVSNRNDNDVFFASFECATRERSAMVVWWWWCCWAWGEEKMMTTRPHDKMLGLARIGSFVSVCTIRNSAVLRMLLRFASLCSSVYCEQIFIFFFLIRRNHKYMRHA